MSNAQQSIKKTQDNSEYRNTEEYDRVRKAIIKRKGAVTVGDIISDTGLGDIEAKEALGAIIKDYDGTLRVSEEGELVYAFDPEVTGRDNRSWFQKHKDDLYRLAVKLFKILFSIVFLLYLSIFVIAGLPFILLCIIVIKCSGFNVDFKAFFERRWQSLFGYNNIEKIKWLNAEKGIDLLKDIVVRPPFYQRLCNFVFGPVRYDAINEERSKCAQLIRSKSGVITAEDWIFISGKSKQEAEHQLARFTAEFGGTAEITENGTLVYIFEDMMKSVHSGIPEFEPAPSWRSLEMPEKLTENETKDNILIILVSVWLLSLFGFGSVMTAIELLADNPNYTLGLPLMIGTFIPALLFLSILVIPLFRLPGHLKDNRLRRNRSVKKAALGVFAPFYHGNEIIQNPFSASAFTETANRYLEKFKQPNVKPQEIKQAIQAICDDLDGNSENEGAYTFESVAAHLKDVENERTRLGLDNPALGRIVFSSSNDEQEIIEDAEEKQAQKAFDRELNASDGSRDNEDKLPALNASDIQPIFMNYSKKREWILETLRRSVQTQGYAASLAIMQEYPPDVIQDDTYSTYTDLVNKGIKEAEHLEKINNCIENFLFDKLDPPLSFFILGALDCFFAYALFFSEKGSIPLALIFVLDFVLSFIIVSTFKINPFRNLSQSVRRGGRIGLFIFTFLMVCVIASMIYE